MKIFKTTAGIVIEKEEKFYLIKDQNWDSFINDDTILQTASSLIASLTAGGSELIQDVMAPVGNQELWACGVTYMRSKVGRQEESKLSGGADFYAKVYDAERPEVFFKATAHRIVGPGEKVNIRKDSTWDVPEPELTLVVTSSGKIIGYTIGNDMSSRSIEGENPLYLPQAKTYDACAALGPCIYLTEEPLPPETMISLVINRNNEKVFEGNVAIHQMKRTVKELASYVYRECSFPHGCLIMTGTGIVPGNDFTLQQADEIKISIEGIGQLVNHVA
ncbi:fumarylacetoacetate hydrolase family protein [Ferruginibacter sp. HRS2-29]|uniref:fumarylacetoacetate hydrolase family protein n=1 Tax=Ferruginibacter sp. HRS2-29 TaxID=2487334 RepID=UPI0020CF37E1|nr:fumarylacetoacetate hydrolase family protein [Ferruginibacter sp. HRS2-29]MCP9753443.1 2-hydroxyhepta-2,4-diene-1,7-dioate isomerase [Ferruginibacter sp. HRS2-29]